MDDTITTRRTARTPEAPARPIYLDGHLAPVPDEIDSGAGGEATDLPVTGTLPRELAGRYFRNGPNPLPGQDPGHWFTGHGMVHGVRIRDGRAEWYRNRWVRTRMLEGARFLGPDGSIDLAAVPANTHVVEHAGRLLALVENGLPYELTRELDTVGPCDFGGRLTTSMTAHPKCDPVTGELFFFGYSALPPYLTYHRLSAAGELVHSAVIDVPGPTMMHDFAITEHHVIWLDLPVAFDLSLLGHGMPYRWDDGYGARLGVMPRYGDGTQVRWFDIEPCYVFHVGNAHEDFGAGIGAGSEGEATGRIVLDAVRYGRSAWDRTWSTIGGVTAAPAGIAAAAAGTAESVLHRWTLDPATGRVSEQQMDDRGVEFPTLDGARTGRGNRYLYAVSDSLPGGRTGGRTGGVVKYDLATGTGQAHELAPGLTTGEAVFVPAAGAQLEDEGWLLSIVTDRAGRGSELLVLDATDVAAPAVASVRLPRAVPAGFHGSWIPDAGHG